MGSEVLEKIKFGEPIEYDHVIVKGNLSLAELDLLAKEVDRTPIEMLASRDPNSRNLRALKVLDLANLLTLEEQNL